MDGITTPQPTIYDLVPYPSDFFAQTSPGRMAARAALLGLAAPNPETARVLEVGCGAGVNLLSLAMAYPEASFHGFDLASTAIAEGNALRAAARIENASLETLDVLDAAERLAGPFDYIICHGFYTWVSEAERQAVLDLIGRLLSPEGIAFMSFASHPGATIRQVLREMIELEVGTIEDPASRAQAGHEVLLKFIAGSSQNPTLELMRKVGQTMADRDPATLFHDEMATDYAPVRIDQVIAEAAAHGLAYLHDMDDWVSQPLLPTGMDDQPETLGRQLMRQDFQQLRGFRQSLFVRSGRNPLRVAEPARARSLLVSTHASRGTGRNEFLSGGISYTIDEEPLHRLVELLIERAPERLPVGDLDLDESQLFKLVKLFDAGLIDLSYGRARMALTFSPQPVTSPLARAMIAQGARRIPSLDHGMIDLEDEAARHLVSLFDGSRTAERIADEWRNGRYSAQHPIETGYLIVRKLGLLAE